MIYTVKLRDGLKKEMVIGKPVNTGILLSPESVTIGLITEYDEITGITSLEINDEDFNKIFNLQWNYNFEISSRSIIDYDKVIIKPPILIKEFPI